MKTENKISYEINLETLQDLINIENGLFKPLTGFMKSADYTGCVHEMKLADGTVWTVPITLDVDEETVAKLNIGEKLFLTSNGKEMGSILVEEVFETDIEKDTSIVYKTLDTNHPGVRKEFTRNKYRVGGKTEIIDKSILEGTLSPEITKKHFKDMGWKTVCGFQTRNPVHRAHEHLQRVAMDLCDGIFINPLVGWKKIGDFSEDAVVDGYMAMLENYYPEHNVFFMSLKTQMRYLGPREAVFHATIRKNLGCTHFIVGRDHAGVGDYYGRYEAQELVRKLQKENDLGIYFLLIKEPYYCKICGHIVSESSCRHRDDDIEYINGTMIRSLLAKGHEPDERFMRKEVADAIIELGEKMFVTEE